ncbi:MAG: hypothetical protein ACQEVA_12335 [Myxococcota bacterium]
MSVIPEVLCHPDAEKSCGACCGMYNRVDSDESSTLHRLAERTRAYVDEADIEDEDSLSSFRARWETTDADQKLLEGLPNCPFLGLLGLDDDRAQELSEYKVGCLVHPLQNDGIDGRDCGVYDRQICEEYLCAAHDILKDYEKWLVIQSTSDSYLYGLVITDVKFVRQLFERVAEINGKYPGGSDVQRAGVASAAADYFELKRDWPYAGEDGVFGQMVPGEGLETSRRAGPSEALGAQPDAFEAILTCLGTQLETRAELRDARRLVRDRVEAVARAIEPDLR